MSLNAFITSVAKGVIKENTKQKYDLNSNKIVSLKNLNLLKKYEFELSIKKIKNGYQLLIFFNDKGNKILVYATKSGQIQLFERHERKNIFSKEQVKISYLAFTDEKDSKNFYSWCGKLRNGNKIVDEWNKQRTNINFLN